MRARSRQKVPPPASESPLNPYERLLGVDFEKELIPLLGNEIALSLPLRTFTGSAPQPQTEPGVGDASQPKSPPTVPSPLLAISIRDREAVRALVPRILESLGLKGAALLAQTQRRENTELVTYAGVFAYAFIDDFMLISTDAAAVTHTVDSYLERQTLASDSYFRNATRWQPRQVLGQLYISRAFMQSDTFIQDVNSISDQTMRDFLMSIGPSAEPVTYALSNEGMGPLHELHLPRNLVMLVIASISGQSALAGIAGNEAQAQSALRAIGSAQAAFKATKGDGRFASLTELIDEGLLSASSVQQKGYRVEVVVSGTGFEARAIPQEYGKTGKLSFFLDESTILRGGDHGGGPATVADKPLGQ
jgi:hypothetical protein